MNLSSHNEIQVEKLEKYVCKNNTEIEICKLKLQHPDMIFKPDNF